MMRARWPQWLEREFTDRKVYGSNPSSASRLLPSRFGQPGSTPALVQPSGSMTVTQWRDYSIYTEGRRYTSYLVFTIDSIESLVCDILQLNVLRTGRLMFQSARYSLESPAKTKLIYN
ncbi:hypothetical protein T265_10522 [Opisthorchis viverrini]|uniref:Uncharacterized protein n=1 Tax=Opisthorchis viverrini TaxID=6198 RepID=A0A074Z260_OPIVI|nr:hypothetical protein T265_10522 [Opisthorchis viverrini]KER21078.1 hypothetical protein T265_10522 [Opisthorchis viverrini]